MQIIISNIIEIIEPNNEVKNYCKDKLTFKNPDYQKKKAMGYSVWKTPKDIKLYDFYNERLYLPIGCFDDIWVIHPYISDYKDFSVSRGIQISSNIILRNYQEPCLKAIEENYTGLFILPAG